MTNCLRASCLLTLCLVLSWSLTGCVTPLPLAKARVMEYYEGGQYEKEVAKAYQLAARRLPVSGSYNAVGSAVVMDIDDTVLSTYDYQKSMGFGHYGPTWHQWIALGRAQAIRPALAFFLLAKERGLAVFFVTGRREKFREITEENLRSAGFTGWQGLYMKPTDWSGDSVADWKASQRMAIETKGYRILLNIGDSRSDLRGGHATHTVLLPNLIYDVR